MRTLSRCHAHRWPLRNFDLSSSTINLTALRERGPSGHSSCPSKCISGAPTEPAASARSFESQQLLPQRGPLLQHIHLQTPIIAIERPSASSKHQSPPGMPLTRSGFDHAAYNKGKANTKVNLSDNSTMVHTAHLRLRAAEHSSCRRRRRHESGGLARAGQGWLSKS